MPPYKTAVIPFPIRSLDSHRLLPPRASVRAEIAGGPPFRRVGDFLHDGSPTFLLRISDHQLSYLLAATGHMTLLVHSLTGAPQVAEEYAVEIFTLAGS